jgi:hypothetical protein
MSLVGIAAIGFLLVAIFGRQFVGALLVVGVIIVIVTVANLGKPPATPPVAANIPTRPLPRENVNWRPNSNLTCSEMVALVGDNVPECYQHRGTSPSH